MYLFDRDGSHLHLFAILCSKLFCMYFIPLVTSSQPSPCPIHPKRERATPRSPNPEPKGYQKKKTPWKITIYKKSEKAQRPKKDRRFPYPQALKSCNPIRSIYICCMRVASCLFESKIAKKKRKKRKSYIKIQREQKKRPPHTTTQNPSR
jgi:hypothetical protein